MYMYIVDDVDCTVAPPPLLTMHSFEEMGFQ
jgi:hypothetical protein